MDLGLEIKKFTVGLWISIWVSIFRHIRQLWLFLAHICLIIDLRLGIQKTNIGIRITITEILWVPIFRQNGQLSLFRSSFPQKWILRSEFKNLIVDLELAPRRCYVCIFTDKIDNFEFFHLNFGKLLNFMWYFGSNNIEGVAKNSVEAEMNWVHGLVIP